MHSERFRSLAYGTRIRYKNVGIL